jgi:uncharacterized protein YgiM (DUF1202 family)
MKIYIRSILILLLLALPAVAAYSETRYVSDELVITLRAGKGDAFRIKTHGGLGSEAIHNLRGS